MTRNLLLPNWETGNLLSHIKKDDLKSRGIKGLLIDVDGTVIAGNYNKVDDCIITWIEVMKKDLKLFLISNNPSKERISNIAKQLHLDYIHSALKPRRKSILSAINALDLDPSNIAIVGDRILTDVLGGNRLGIYTILVKPIGKNGFIDKESNLQNVEIILSKIISRLLP
ncbi:MULTISPECIES: YqeG family HAD IIIA-type phosphatase [Prochlorococcus]|uniref:YqeG family HAD IIIA-type phosphatase n=1 Tax=Prochlorococcus TaxID=1218 RepID=UPI000533B245|nr:MULTISPECIES: YqeG family HAD IIIA-type phosphatase [Prochlorococcus]KGG12374.1 putative hydrolase of the HAD [Prochlorococcus sp. MIT 0601]